MMMRACPYMRHALSAGNGKEFPALIIIKRRGKMDKMVHFPIEPDETGNPFREEYLRGIRKLIEEEQRKADDRRRDKVKDILRDPEGCRKQLAELLGWPLAGREKRGSMQVRECPVTSKEGITVKRLQIEALPGLFFYGLLFQKGEQKRPLVIAQHGGGGTPELASGFLQQGTVNYNDMVGRVLQYGVHVFAPQMLLWDPVRFQSDSEGAKDPGEIRRQIDQQLKQLGGSITALELSCLMGSLDYLERQPFVCAERIGMVGLSYGGFYTLYAAAVDTRIKSALCSCFFRKQYDNLWTDFVWQDAAHQFLDSEVAMLVYPRRLSIQLADRDQIFEFGRGREEMEKLQGYAAGTKSDWLTLDAFSGEHEFWKDAEPVERLIRDLMGE